jgi:hypothetical protein
MIDAPHRCPVPELRLGNGALLCLTRHSAYKLFWGAGAGVRFNHELERVSSARDCPVWGPHILPMESGRIPRLMRSERGDAIPPGPVEDEALYSFVEGRLRAATRQCRPLPALEVIDARKLLIGLGEQAFFSIIDPLQELLGNVWLPSGPAHGDLHRGNIIKAHGSYFVIDWDGFNAASSPVFDRIHFDLAERRLTHRLRWADLLAESDDLVVSAMEATGISSASPAEIALAYGINRVALEAFRISLYGRRPRAKSYPMAVRLLETCGDRRGAPRSIPMQIRWPG